ncbi:AraC family transcriptional regulator [Mucilaginibacter sp. CAU 1740]|uniref:helix-turn-helix domain-containing protein n=1 Tax=Mucilaginibacter sp. CAU 1740 TaxID=3140365 RepID=UPI00325A93E7
MEIKNLYRPYELELLETDSYTAKPHRNTFFEMVFTLEGTGVQIINEHELPYTANKFFLIFPEDKHGFEVHDLTRFYFIHFTDSYLKTQSDQWVKKMEFIFHNHNHLPGCILKTVTDKPLVRAMVEALIRETSNLYPQHNQVLEQVMNAIITIAARNITLQQRADIIKQPSATTLPLLNYIHENIYQPERLRVEHMASCFNLSPNYISEYFKKTTGESLQQYITGYKIKLIETRLQYTDKRMGEIAYEFGFTDESHLNRIFKKYKGENPTAFRKKYAELNN